jgi:hypothetical protein
MVHLHATCDHQAVATKLHSARPFRCCQEPVIPGTYGVKYGRGRWLEPKLPRESHGIFTKFAVCFPAITQKMEVSNIILKLSDERPFHLSFGGESYDPISGLYIFRLCSRSLDGIHRFTASWSANLGLQKKGTLVNSQLGKSSHLAG